MPIIRPHKNIFWPTASTHPLPRVVSETLTAQAEICVSFATDNKSLVSSADTHGSTCSPEVQDVSLTTPSPNKVISEDDTKDGECPGMHSNQGQHSRTLTENTTALGKRISPKHNVSRRLILQIWIWVTLSWKIFALFGTDIKDTLTENSYLRK